MAVYLCKVRITNSKYTLPIPPFEVTASNWPLAAHRATSRALLAYKQIRGRRDRPIEIEVTASQRAGSSKHLIETEEEVNDGLR